MRHILLSLLFLLCLLPYTIAQHIDQYINVDAVPRLLLSEVPEHIITKSEFPTSVTYRGDGITAPMDSLLQSILDKYYQDLGVKGLSAAVLLDDGRVWKGTAGYSYIDNADTVFMQPHMSLGIGSVSKIVTAATVLKLTEEGLLDLDDEIGEYIDVFANVNPNASIEEVLKHTSGIFSYTEHPAFNDSLGADITRHWQPEEVLENFINTPYFPPGFGWYYSNTNYLILGMIIENITGQNYHDVVQQKIFSALDSSYFRLLPQQQTATELAHVYVDVNGDGNSDDVTALMPLTAFYSTAWSSGAYMATPTDLVHFLQTLFTGGILENSSINAMQTTYNLGNGLGYGLGIIRIPGEYKKRLGTQWRFFLLFYCNT